MACCDVPLPSRSNSPHQASGMTNCVMDFDWLIHSEGPQLISSFQQDADETVSPLLLLLTLEDAGRVKNLRQTCEIKKCLLVHLSSGWPGCWRSGRPRLYRTRPPQWSTLNTEPGCKPHQHPSLPAPGQVSRPAVLCPSSVPSSFSCSSVFSPAPFCIVTPRLSSPCSSWRTWLDTASCTCHAWVETTEILSVMISAEKHFKQASFNKGMNRWVVYLEKSSLTVTVCFIVLFCPTKPSKPQRYSVYT